MKSLTFLIIFLVSIANLSAQIPNAGFENWTNGEPDNWLTNNLLEAWITVSPNGTSFSGTSSAKIEVADFGGFPIYPVLTSTFPINQNYASLNGYYQFNATVSDMVLIGIVFTFKNGLLIGAGELEINSASSNYTQFGVEIQGNGQIPDSVMIQFQIISNNQADPGIGTYALIDQLSFGQTTDVDNADQLPFSFKLDQNYPNPFNPSTKISWQSPIGSHQTLKVYNVLGNEVMTLIDEYKEAGNYEIDFNPVSSIKNLASGIYFYRLNVGGFVESKKMTLIK